MRILAVEHGYDLSQSYSYSDSSTDLPMLEVVGHPVAVNPDAALRAVAADRGWPVLDFARPVAMKTVRQRVSGLLPHEPRRAAVGVAAGAVALGVAWYAARRRSA